MRSITECILCSIERFSHWAEVENYSRRNSLCSYLNKPQIVLFFAQKCRSDDENVGFMKLPLKDVAQNLLAVKWVPGAGSIGRERGVQQDFLNQAVS